MYKWDGQYSKADTTSGLQRGKTYIMQVGKVRLERTVSGSIFLAEHCRSIGRLDYRPRCCDVVYRVHKLV